MVYIQPQGFQNHFYKYEWVETKKNYSSETSWAANYLCMALESSVSGDYKLNQ